MIASRDDEMTLRKRFERGLSTNVFGRHSQWHSELDSTNSTARAWADSGAPHGALVFADHQIRGRGRHERAWFTSPGLNLTVSLVLRPTFSPTAFGLITLAASLAAHETIQTLCPTVSVAIKWPNDILADGQKCCGMLLESAIASEAGASFVVLGVGINVNQVEFPDLIQSLATSMMLATGQFFDRGFVLAELVNRLEKNLLLLEEAPEDIVSAYQDLLAGVGNPLSVSDVHTGSSFEGTMLGIDDAGALLLDMGSHVQSFHAGDVKLLSSELSSE